jgi:hypothetical protein
MFQAMMIDLGQRLLACHGEQAVNLHSIPTHGNGNKHSSIERSLTMQLQAGDFASEIQPISNRFDECYTS